MKKFLVLLAFVVSSCGQQEAGKRIVYNNPTPEDNEITILKETVLKLQGTVAQINNFVASDFATCDSVSLPAFETKLCQIAQTATAEQQLILYGQLQELQDIMQVSIYGGDCVDDVAVGCPAAGSILDQLDAIDVSSITSDISDLQSDVAALQSDVTNLETAVDSINDRLDDFDGSGDTIETVISGIESDIVSLDSRLDDLEAVVGGSDYYEWIFIGSDIASVSAKEPVLRTGDKLNVVAYVNSSTNNGMGLIAEANVSGDQYFETDIKPKVQFKIYDLTTELKICWNNDNRNASSASIDTVCDEANSFAAPTVDCTCK